ncbi:MAG: sialidase family protein, partial [Thermoguttaceae bacterium]
MTSQRIALALLAFSFLPASLQANDPARDWPSAIVPKVYFEPGEDTSDEVRMWQGIPGLERGAGGRLWATWYGGGVTEDRHNYIMLVTSGDDGKTWSDLKMVIDPDGPGPVRAFDPCLWIDPDGKLWLFWCQATRGGGGDPVTFAMTTDKPDDANPEWSEPRFIHDGVMMNKPTVLSDGAWLLPTAIWRREDSCRVVASTDQGATWELRGTANVPDPKDRNCDEPMLVERKDGSLWQLVRTRYGIGESTSTDGGRTWTPVSPWNVEHTASRFFIRRLHSGKLLLVKHGPIKERTGRSHLTAYLSEDDGKTWQGGLLLDERSGVSYPDGAQADDGAIYIIYDYDRAGEKFIHMAVFTEEDVLAEKCVSDPARLRVVVNQALGINPRVAARAEAAEAAIAAIEFDANADGKPMLDGEAAELEPVDGRVEPVKRGAVLFTDRNYKIRD